ARRLRKGSLQEFRVWTNVIDRKSPITCLCFRLLPGHLGDFGGVIDKPGRDKQIVAKPVEIANDPRRDSNAGSAGQRDDAALGAAADTTRNMDQASAAAARREDKLLERRQVALQLIDGLLQERYVRIPYQSRP